MIARPKMSQFEWKTIELRGCKKLANVSPVPRPGAAPHEMNAWDLETYANGRVIAVDQDPLGAQGAVVRSDCPAHVPKDNWWCSPWSMPRDVADVWTRLLFTLAALAAASAALAALAGRPKAAAPFCLLALGALSYTRVLAGARPVVPDCAQVWAKPLADFGVALLFLNWGPNATTLACDAACLAAAGLDLDAAGAAAPAPPVARLAGDAAYDAALAGPDAHLAAALAGDGASLLLKVGGLPPGVPLVGPWGADAIAS